MDETPLMVMFGDEQIRKHKELIEMFVDLVNQRNIEKLTEIFHPNVQLDLFSVAQAEFVTIVSLANVLDIITNVTGKTDITYEILEIFVKTPNRLLVRLNSSGTYFVFKDWPPLDEPFEDEMIYIINFENDKMIKLEQIRDSIQILQKAGRAALKADNKLVMQQYITTLNKLDIFSDKIRGHQD